jgi:hypothetical protein
MKQAKQEKLTQKTGKTFTGWERVIQDTEEAIQRSRVRLRELKATLRVFEDRRDSGEPWPGTTQQVAPSLSQAQAPDRSRPEGKSEHRT